MHIIPVIDIRNGVVVRAVAGDRQNYRPLVSPLAATPTPRDVAQGLLAFHPFDTLYIADLDAIEARGDNRAAIVALAHSLPQTRFWIDAGASTAKDAASFLAPDNVDIVVGSESLASAQDVASFNPARSILSLDFRGESFLGPEQLLTAPALWPARVIAMTLAHIGMNAGPDEARLAAIRATGARALYAAGGVRGEADLLRLKERGVFGALVASALHDGALSTEAIARLAKK